MKLISNAIMKAKIKNLKQGEFFRLKDSETAPVWIRGEYDRLDGINKYLCTKFDDISHGHHYKGDKEVYIVFEF